MTTCVDNNFARQNGFMVIVPEAPNLSATIIEAPLPSISMGEALQSTPTLDMTHPGDKITWNSFVIQFRLQETLANYKEVYDWMTGLAHPYSLENRVPNIEDGLRDITIQVMNNNQNPGARIILRGCFPTDMSEIPFGTATDEEMVISATFRYMYFDLGLDTGGC